MPLHIGLTPPVELVRERAVFEEVGELQDGDGGAEHALPGDAGLAYGLLGLERVLDVEPELEDDYLHNDRGLRGGEVRGDGGVDEEGLETLGLLDDFLLRVRDCCPV